MTQSLKLRATCLTPADPPRLIRKSQPVLHVEVRDPLEVSEIASNHGQSLDEGNRGYHDVRVAD